MPYKWVLMLVSTSANELAETDCQLSLSDVMTKLDAPTDLAASSTAAIMARLRQI
jgi:hypothetical protein